MDGSPPAHAGCGDDQLCMSGYSYSFYWLECRRISSFCLHGNPFCLNLNQETTGRKIIMLQPATVPFPHSLCVFDALSQQDLDHPAVAKGAAGQTGNSSVACIRSSRTPAARLPTCTHFTNVKNTHSKLDCSSSGATAECV